MMLIMMVGVVCAHDDTGAADEAEVKAGNTELNYFLTSY